MCPIVLVETGRSVPLLCPNVVFYIFFMVHRYRMCVRVFSSVVLPILQNVGIHCTVILGHFIYSSHSNCRGNFFYVTS